MNLKGLEIVNQRNLTAEELELLGLDPEIKRTALELSNGALLFASTSATGGNLGFLTAGYIFNDSPEILISEDN